MHQKTAYSSDNVLLSYIHNKIDNKPTIIFIHGAGSNHTVYKPFFNLNHNFIAIDIRNHGKSSRSKNITIQRISEDIWDICKKEKIKDTILIGNSLGASIALDFYKNHRWNVKKMILLTLFSKRYIKHPVLFNNLASMFYTILKPFAGKRPLKFQDYHKYKERPIWYYPYLDFRGTPITTVLKLVKELFQYPIYAYNIKVPTLIFVAEKDWSTKNELIKSDCKSNKNIKLVELKSNHVPLVRIYDDVLKGVNEFLNHKL